ncbi:MAG TPA: DUF4333 domain-containing protein [Solirubrobacteraceae bacterium]|nr:DUF4333 domain-containing protein [Solirubrobacteraceae bacterium]
MKRTLLLTLPVVAALSLSGCTGTIDHKKAEDLVRKAVANAGKTTVTSVKCPSGVKDKKGQSFDCTVALGDGTKGAITEHILGGGKVEINGPSDFKMQ